MAETGASAGAVNIAEEGKKKDVENQSILAKKRSL